MFERCLICDLCWTLFNLSHPVCLHVCLQAAVWQALNHYAYLDAVFLAERLYAEGIFWRPACSDWHVIANDLWSGAATCCSVSIRFFTLDILSIYYNVIVQSLKHSYWNFSWNLGNSIPMLRIMKAAVCGCFANRHFCNMREDNGCK